MVTVLVPLTRPPRTHRTSADLPYPPIELASRVGSLEAADDPMAYYDELGRLTGRDIVAQLPGDWSFAGKRVLDFGCGAGRTLRHFVGEAAEAEIWGSDIDISSINWLRGNLCPPFHVLANAPEPPLEQPTASFDLIWSVSVFTHLTGTWSRWLVELHRILKPGGLLFLTFMGSGIAEVITGEPWLENQIGMNVTRAGQSWDLGGPMVLHSPWWIEEHWGRGFEIISMRPGGFASEGSTGQGSVLLRRRDVSVTPELFERIRPEDEREAPALAHNIDQLQREMVGLRDEIAYARTRPSDGASTELERELVETRALLRTIEQSKSWTITRPLRNLARALRAYRG